MSATANDWRDVPLEGRLLVEASAGTGKTWTMAALYLRLLLEGSADGQPLTPDRIVVATYTEAAAQELGERLRARVTAALQAAQAHALDHAAELDALDRKDPVACWLADRWQDEALRSHDRQRLRSALAQLDRAPIGTLHGLCYRLLIEHPVDGGLGFSPPRLGEGQRVHEALARDLLRHIGAGTLPTPAIRLPKKTTRIEGLVKALRFVLQPGVTVAEPPSEAEVRAAIDTPTEAVLRDLLQKEGHYAHATNTVLNTVKSIVAWLDGGPWPKSPAPLITDAEIDKPRVLPAARNKLREPAFQAAIQRLDTLHARYDSAERAFWAYWAPTLRQWRDQRSAELGELGFDPLIERVRAVMEQPDGALANAVFTRWPVALVDEFQDTDGTQYALLDRWYRDADATPRGLLAMVGDPKQAIYGFRGGDVQAYLRARSQATTTLALGVNQRSSAAYVEACNALFDGPRAGLSAKPESAIRYRPVEAAGRADQHCLHEHGQPVDRPLVIHQHAQAECNAVARPQALSACVELIVDLLQPGRFTFGAHGTALAPGDIAVLLRTNAEIDDLRRALQRRGVPCAGQSRQQVFDGDTARHLLLVLHAVWHPSDSGALRAALLTPLFGRSLADVAALDDEGELETWREQLLRWRQAWQRRGVLAAVLAVLDTAQSPLATHRDAERIATDLRHLGELLQERESEGHAPNAVLDWLRAQRQGDTDDTEARGERSLRLESDARRVRLMTLHASKGLEFPIVLLPTLWGQEARQSTGEALASADAEGHREALFESEAIKALRSDEQDERFRLLYVALTRAVQACHLFVLPEGRPAQRNEPTPKTDPERSPLDALMSRWPEDERDGAATIDWRPCWPAPTSTVFDAAAHAEAVDDHADAAVAAPGPFVLPARWSFSRLAGGHERRAVESAAADDELPRDAAIDVPDGAALEADTTDEVDKPLPTVAHDERERERIDIALNDLAEVGGIPFGNALHALLESAAPNQRFSDELPAVLTALARHAVSVRGGTPLPVIAQRVAAMLDRALYTPLPMPPLPDGRALPELRLGELATAQRQVEMGFHFALGESSLAALRRACEAHGEPTLVPPGGAERLSGWMEGSIDLVFEHGGRVHVLDWKGNALRDADAATPEALVSLMNHHHYRFQALLYTVALQRLLRQRRGETYRAAEHLGAPIYVFLRAAGLAPGLGLWTQRFSEALIDAVDAALAGHADITGAAA